MNYKRGSIYLLSSLRRSLLGGGVQISKNTIFVRQNLRRQSLYICICKCIYVYNKRAMRGEYGINNSQKDKPEEIIKIDGGIPAIISKDVYLKSKEMMKQRKKALAANKAKEQLIFCGECGAFMRDTREEFDEEVQGYSLISKTVENGNSKRKMLKKISSWSNYKSNYQLRMEFDKNNLLISLKSVDNIES
jgi:hypothetical protein